MTVFLSSRFLRVGMRQALPSLVLLIGAVVCPLSFNALAQTGDAPTPRFVTITVTPSHVHEGQPVTLAWETANADEVIFGGKQPLPTSGSMQLTPTRTHTYEIIARSQSGSAQGFVTVVVDAETAAEEPVIRFFNPSAQSVQPGEVVTLRWETANSDLVLFDPGSGKPFPVEPSGSEQRRPQKTTTYQLVARTRTGQEVQRSITVEVRKAEATTPRIIFFKQSATSVVPGGAIALSWRVEDADEVMLLGPRESGMEVGQKAIRVPAVGSRKILFPKPGKYVCTLIASKRGVESAPAEIHVVVGSGEGSPGCEKC